jgi:hypothetical protein
LTHIGTGGEIILAFAGLAAFGVSLLACLYILLPRPLVFSVHGAVLYETFYGRPQHEIHRYLAYWFNAYHDVNAESVTRMMRVFTFGAAGGVLTEVVLWSWHLATR